MENSKFYHPSGNFSSLGMAFSLCIYMIIATIFGFIYASLTIIIPVIYFNFLFTFGLSFILGIFVRLIVVVTKNRNRKNQIIQAIILGIMANLIQWVVFLQYCNTGHLPTFNVFLGDLSYYLNPQAFFGMMAEINHYGMWSIATIPFKGFLLATVWIIEFLVIIAGPVASILKMSAVPFSEVENKWYRKYTLYKDFESVSMVNRFVEQLEVNPIEAVRNLGKGNGIRHSKVHIHYLPNDPISYLSLEVVFVENRGQGKKNGSMEVVNFAIDNATAKTILDEFPHQFNWKEMF